MRIKKWWVWLLLRRHSHDRCLWPIRDLQSADVDSSARLGSWEPSWKQVDWANKKTLKPSHVDLSRAESRPWEQGICDGQKKHNHPPHQVDKVVLVLRKWELVCRLEGQWFSSLSPCLTSPLIYSLEDVFDVRLCTQRIAVCPVRLKTIGRLFTV